jgi:DNA helicase II / ATP-dependent DNA helicase PcrA
MRFFADFHIHSRYSRATSRSADLEGYLRWARAKGISVVGTGDFTHPAWISEIERTLAEEDGLLSFRADPGGSALLEGAPADLPVRFILSTEISSIYKKKGSTRKVHSLLLVPTIQDARLLGRRLAEIGNITSDGRPILGLDPKDLLSILLDITPRGILIPAHIWTPWFSLFGSKSGFDAIEDCFEDLTPCITALETGLSSDPGMNRRWSALDRFRLVSNSDAHSPPNLGREANVFDTQMSFDGIGRALGSGPGFQGTLEFYPEEGKYHADGHRKCGICLEPEETARAGGTCPQCGKPLTVGVLNRVLSLADRGFPVHPRQEEAFKHIIPLPEILSEICRTGTGSRSVEALYARLVSAFGSEYAVLLDAPLEDLSRQFGAVAGEAVRRLRDGLVHPVPGYDGEFGRIRLFSEAEIEEIKGQDQLFHAAPREPPRSPAAFATRRVPPLADSHDAPRALQPSPSLDPDQEAAAKAAAGITLVAAGPGTGKTRIIVHWLSWLLASGKAKPAELLAITFTNRAAGEMKDRLCSLLRADACELTVTTFHSFAYSVLREQRPELSTVYGPRNRQQMLRLMFPRASLNEIGALSTSIESHYEGVSPAEGELLEIILRYEGLAGKFNSIDLSALVPKTIELLEKNPNALEMLRERYRYIAVDELQDINRPQYRLLQFFSDPSLYMPLTECRRAMLCIGDPNQAIYGFRGSDISLFTRFADEAATTRITLRNTYRSTSSIVAASAGLLTGRSASSSADAAANRAAPLISHKPPGSPVTFFHAKDPLEEGRFIANTIRELVGGVDSVSVDAVPDNSFAYSFSDFAILFRNRLIRDALLPPLLDAGLPLTLRDSSAFCQQEPLSLLISALRLFNSPDDIPSLVHLLMHWNMETRLLSELHDLLTSLPYKADSLAACGVLSKSGTGPAAKVMSLLSASPNFSEILQSRGIFGLIETLVQRFFANDFSDNIHSTQLQILLEMAAFYGNKLSHFLRDISLFTCESEPTVKAQRILLSTFHGAKGLEFPVVFIAGAESEERGQEYSIDEERRLFYVAMTRAIDKLFISASDRRVLYGRSIPRKNSDFLADIVGLRQTHIEVRIPNSTSKVMTRQLKLFD